MAGVRFLSRCFLLLLITVSYPGIEPTCLKPALAGTAAKNVQASLASISFASGYPEDFRYFRIHKALYTEAFRRLGHEFHVKSYPDVRALLIAASGEVDGLAGRIYDLNKSGKYPDLIRVDEPIMSLKAIALAINPDIRVKGWESLKGRRIAYSRGNLYIENNLHRYVDKKDVIDTADYFQDVRLLLSGKVDTVITLEEVLKKIKKNPEFSDKSIINAGIVSQLHVYPYLYKKHKMLVPELAGTLKEMKKDGTFQELTDGTK